MRRLLATLIFLAGCAKPETALPPIILISVDTLRSDHLAIYGYTKNATPNIDALRRDGVLYEKAWSHAPLTLPSHASMLTGLLPTEHGVRNNIGYRFDGARLRTLAEVLREKGYRTGAAVSSYVLRSETGISDGFDLYEDSIPVTVGAATAENQRSGFETVKHAQQFIAANAQNPFFLFLHIYEPHAPYEPSYDGEIAKSDAILGQLIATLKSSGVYDRAVIVFTSDHGEALWEHGEDQHGILLYREVLQVPLVIKLPQSERAGSSVAEPFALRQLFHELLAHAGVETPSPKGTIYSETLYPRIHLGWSELRSMFDGRYHYIESSSPELYDVDRDPAEKNNLIANERRVAASMRTALAAIPTAVEKMDPISAEDAKKLAALGYVGTPKERTGPLPNPREQIATLQQIKQAFALAAEHRNDEAIDALRALLKTNPSMDVATRLGEVLMDSGRADEAIAVYEAAIQRAERFSPDLALALAVAHAKAGHPREAEQHAELTLAGLPFEAHELLARVAIDDQRFAEAEHHVRAAIEASNRQPAALLLLADLQRQSGQYDAALETLNAVESRAAELGIAQQGIDHARADVYARTDRPDEAVAAYRREIAKFPHHLQSYANLAIIEMILGKPREAELLLQQMVAANPHRGARELARKTREATTP
ncbi:MAG TPA: sulfatase-like hydrolase/transferase [Thermoanaerobaculia bacterium]|jgi:tetratricopeptide (TPR) repeat protein|nr:sulfatase-like hydrolase/transferase [Thermoanaerobaculia bacterium]